MEASSPLPILEPGAWGAAPAEECPEQRGSAQRSPAERRVGPRRTALLVPQIGGPSADPRRPVRRAERHQCELQEKPWTRAAPSGSQTYGALICVYLTVLS